MQNNLRRSHGLSSLQMTTTKPFSKCLLKCQLNKDFHLYIHDENVTYIDFVDEVEMHKARIVLPACRQRML